MILATSFVFNVAFSSTFSSLGEESCLSPFISSEIKISNSTQIHFISAISGIVDGKRRNDVRRQAIKPADRLWLSAPKVFESVSGHVFQMHHFTGTPDLSLSGEVELAADGAVHLRVIPHNDARFFWKILCAYDLCFRIKQLHKPPDDPVADVGKTVWFLGWFLGHG